MSPRQPAPSRLEAAYAAMLVLRAELTARDELIGELRAQLADAHAALTNERAFIHRLAVAAARRAN